MGTSDSAIVIGTGAAGRAAAKGLAAAGCEVTIVEHDRVGGTCLWTGCIPKKALYTSARAVRELNRARQFGVDCKDLSVDWPEVLAWKWHAQESFAGDQEGLLAQRGIRVLRGTARFVAGNRVTVGAETLSADHIIIATGSLPVIPDVEGAELMDISTDALRYPTPPRSLVILGGGFIALEFAAIFASFGARVDVVQRGPRVVPTLDPALGAVAVSRLSQMGVTFHTDSHLTRVTQGPDGLTVTVTGASAETHDIGCERVLAATGRRPALDALGLEAASVALDERGWLVLDEALRTSNQHIWACGDAAGGLMHTPVATMEGEAVARSISTGSPCVPDYSAIPITCFTTPQLAAVGLTVQAAEKAGTQASVHRIDSDAIGASILDDERDFFTQLVVRDSDGVVIGAQIAGPTACDSIYAAAVAVKAGLTSEQLQGVLGVHPSYAEALYYAAW